MSPATASQKLETLIRSAFDEGRCGEYYLVDLEISPSHQVRVFVDGDEGVSLEACVQISRTLRSILDAVPELDGQYALEVSSPGVSRPLRFLRQYLKHTGRTLKLELSDGRTVEGVLAGTGHDTVTLNVPGKEKKSKPEPVDFPFGDITGAWVLVKFGK